MKMYFGLFAALCGLLALGKNFQLIFVGNVEWWNYAIGITMLFSVPANICWAVEGD